MTGGGAPAPVPFFLDTDNGRLFALDHRTDGAPRGSVLILPPFAEELNMSRRMLYLGCRALADAGYRALLADLTGTGESDGDFADARWETWRDDAAAAAAWLEHESGHAPALLGLRTGALLAAAVDKTERLILWQPVGNGQTFLNQFLRIRVAAGLTGDGDKETTQGLRAAWESGGTVEVAGYEVAAALAASMDALRLADMVPGQGTRVDWIEIGDPETGPSPANARTLEAWRAAGADIRDFVCRGEPFWSIQETTVAPAMIEATLDALAAP